jgi:tetratricopeptide (TPR) repeat protein
LKLEYVGMHKRRSWKGDGIMAALGNLALKVLGILGGLLAIVIGLAWLVFGLIAFVSSHVGSAGVLTIAGGAVFMMMGLLAIYSSIIYAKKPRLASKLLLSPGFLGFFVGYAADYAIMGGILGLMTWTVPGTLMVVAGLIGWVTPQRLASSLPLLNNDRGDIRLATKVLYGGLFAGGIIIMMGTLFFSGVMFLGFQEESKSDDDLFSDAIMHESYGKYDSALSVYDRILAKNQSNAEAWMRRGYALEKLGRHYEANESYKRARQLESASSTARAA